MMSLEFLPYNLEVKKSNASKSNAIAGVKKKVVPWHCRLHYLFWNRKTGRKRLVSTQEGKNDTQGRTTNRLSTRFIKIPAGVIECIYRQIIVYDKAVTSAEKKKPTRNRGIWCSSCRERVSKGPTFSKKNRIWQRSWSYIIHSYESMMHGQWLWEDSE